MGPTSRSESSHSNCGEHPAKKLEKSKESRSGPEVKSEKIRDELAGSGEEFDYKPSEKSMEERKVIVRKNSPISDKALEIVLKNESKGNTSGKSPVKESKEPIIKNRKRGDVNKEEKQANTKSTNNANYEADIISLNKSKNKKEALEGLKEPKGYASGESSSIGSVDFNETPMKGHSKFLPNEKANIKNTNNTNNLQDDMQKFIEERKKRGL